MTDQLLLEVVTSLVNQPAVQGALVAAVTELIKKAPIGPTGGWQIRLVAALLALGASLAGAAAAGDIRELNQDEVAKHLMDALAAFLAAVGAWQLTKKK